MLRVSQQLFMSGWTSFLDVSLDGVEYTNGLRSPDLTPCDFFLIGPGKLDHNRPSVELIWIKAISCTQVQEELQEVQILTHVISFLISPGKLEKKNAGRWN